MIQLPRRSVTRFFVPLIDVLILLFCIFLLMPFVSRPADAPAGRDPAADPPTAAPADDAAALRSELAAANRRIDRLLAERADAAGRMSVLVLDIDAATGGLFAFDPADPDPRQEVRDEADARRLVDRLKRQAGTRQPFVLMLYPRRLTGFPLQRQVDTYRRWFRDVPHGFDNPWQPSGV